MFRNWLTYRIVAETLDRELRGFRIGEIFTQDKNEAIIVFYLEEVERVVHFSAHPQHAFLLLRKDFHRAKKNTLSLFESTYGKAVQSIRVVADDRIISIALEGGDLLHAKLYANKSNLLLSYDIGVVAESFKHVDPPLDVSGFRYDDAVEVPSAEDLTALATEKPNVSVSRMLKSFRPYIANELSAEIFHLAGIDAEVKAGLLSEEQFGALQVAAEQCLNEACEKPFYLYLADGDPVHFSLLKLTHVQGYEERIYTDLFEALFDYYRGSDRAKRFGSMRGQVVKAIEKEIGRTERTLKAMDTDEDAAEKADLYEKYGNLLMIHPDKVPEQPGRITLSDMFTDPRLVVSIPLKKGQTVIENAERYFTKARNTRAAVRMNKERKVKTEKHLQELRQKLEEFNAVVSYATFKDKLKDEKAFMASIGMDEKGKKNDTTFPFRRFTVTGGFEVWAGKNSQNNDLLTLRHSKPNDIWMHARGVGGSHVVIKIDSAPGDISKQAIKEAASIAAYYSKYRKAGNVPVAYTQKKYVRKPKGAPPGTVTLQREDVVMVQPGLPEGAADDE